MVNAVIGILVLLAGLYMMTRFLGSSISLKKRDKHNQNNPMDDSIYPSNTPNSQ
ncbi:hypothetical protein [Anoxybacteroides tepidamans]|uniref:hypothetical protein n=1 Tax=Anoxybacteroides tepidamans TaxID=265948 RepID=UPI000A43D293|nr:hypothetical protein [Anoxybacillus tepidamans]